MPTGFVHGAGVWRHVLELADPAQGAGVVWHELPDGVFTGYSYQRGADGYQGRYRASTVNLDLYATDDRLAPWNPDTVPDVRGACRLGARSADPVRVHPGRRRGGRRMEPAVHVQGRLVG